MSSSNASRIVQMAVGVVAALGVGLWLGSRFLAGTPPTEVATKPVARAGEGPCPGGVAPSYWKAPMDPTYIRDAPGKSPMGMDLVPVCPGDSSTDESGVVRIDPTTVQAIGVRTALVERRDLSRSVRAVGRVTYDERRVAHVHTKVQGWIERLYVDFVGQAVRRGEPLLEIYSPELVATQEELLLAARYAQSTADSPFDDVVSGGSSLLEATRRRLELWDVSEADIERLIASGEVKRTLTLHAPTSGVVTMLAVRSGMEVAPNANLYTIADLSTVWVVADVYEYELPWLALGQKGTVELSYLPGVPFTGLVTYISPFLDPKTRTAEVRIELPNPERRLKPAMFGSVLIEAEPLSAVVAVPTEAVIRSGRRAVVILALGEGRFTARDIQLGLDAGDGFTEVTAGLEPGEEVVVSSQFLIDSESKLQEAIQKLLATGREGGGPDADAVDHDAMGHSGRDGGHE